MKTQSSPRTPLLLAVTLLLACWREPSRRRLLAHVAAQAAIWLAVKATLAWLYRSNPGQGAFELHHVGTGTSHLASNLAFVSDPFRLAVLLSTGAGLWAPLLVFGARIRDPLLRWMPRVLCGYAAALFLIANIWEARMFAEFTAVGVCGIAALLTDAQGAPASAAETS